MFAGLRLFGRRSRNFRDIDPAALQLDRALPQVVPSKLGAPPSFSDHHPRLLALRSAFTPNRPQSTFRRVAGRRLELLRILDAIGENRNHVVLYGDRGRGKTSIVNLVAAAARSSGYMVARYSCHHESEFDDIIRGLVRDLPSSVLAAPLLTELELEGCEAALPRERVSPRDIALLPSRLIGEHLLLIIDEFDRVNHVLTRTRLADAIKQVSDRGSPLSFLIVGVSDSLQELLGYHPSIQRNVTAVPLPLLSDPDVNEILELGAQQAGLEYPPLIRSLITRLASGVPYIVHLLALHLGEQALRRGAEFVDKRDVLPGLQRAAAEMSPHVGLIYDKLTQMGLEGKARGLLVRLPLMQRDRFGLLPVEQRGDEVCVAGQVVESALWQGLLDSQTVRPCRGAAPGYYTFAEPMLLHYVLLRAVIHSELSGRGWNADALS